MSRTLLLTVFALGFVVGEVMGQCGTLPAITGIGSNKNPVGLCAPVTSDVSYNITFFTPLPAGPIYRLFFRWGDGSPDDLIVLASGSTNYSATRTHSFPLNSDCEYEVEIIMSVGGVFCTSTQQIQKIASWRTDAFNGGNVSLVSPVTSTTVHEVCEGVDVNVVFNDITNFNCNAVYDPLPTPPTGPVLLPNEQVRWQQIVYNTPIGGSKIPNISVNGVPVTGAGGANIIPNYQDPRGVFVMIPPVVINDPRRRPTLTITAPGGFTPGFPVVGDEFEITLRYWNFCNPYSNAGAGFPPVGGDLINGDNPPVERTALIRIIDSPNAPVVPDRDVCSTQSDLLSVSAPLGAGFTYRWWSNSTLTTQVGTGPTFNPTNGQAPFGRRTHFWVTVESTAAGNCRSAATEVRLTKRTALASPTPISGPNNLCPSSSYTFSVPAGPPTITIIDVTSGNFNLNTEHIWTVPGGWTINSGQGTNSINITTGAGTGAGTVSVVNRYDFPPPTTSGSTCTSNPATTLGVNVRARPTVNITPDPADVCNNSAIQLNGNPSLSFGAVSAHTWGGSTGILDDPTIQQPTVMVGTAPGGYALTYQVVADYGGGVFCASTVDNSTVNVFANPPPATVGLDQNLCFVVPPLISNPLGGSNPAPGIGTWTKLSGPAGVVTFNPNANTANATATAPANGIYVFRWTVTNGPCTSFSDITVDYGTAPPAAVAGPPQDVCGLSATLDGNDPTFATGTWLQTAGPGTSSFVPNANDRNAVVTVTVPGVYTYRWRLTSGTCVPEDAFVTHTFRDPPTVSAPADFTHCLDNPPTAAFNVNLSGTFGGGASQARWERVSGSGTFTSSGGAIGSFDGTNPVDDVYQPSAGDFAAGTVQLRLVTDDPIGGCTPVNDPVTITIDRLPAPAFAGADFSTCDPTAILPATAASNGGNGTWTIGSALYYETFPTSDVGIGLTGPAGIGTFNHPGGNWSIEIVGPSTLSDAADYARVVGGRFEAQDVNDEVVWRSSVIPITAIPNISISLDLIEFGGMEPDDHIRAFYRIDGGGEIFIGGIDDDNTIEGDNNPRTVSVGGLTGNTLQVVVRIDNDAGGEQHKFDNVFVVGAGATLPLIADVNDPNSGVSNLQIGNNTFTWTVNSALGSCSSSNSQVIITRHALPVAVDPLPVLCEDSFGAGDATVTPAFLTTLDNTVNGGNPLHTVAYFIAPTRAPGDEILANILVSNTDVIYTRVTRTDVAPQCTQDGIVTFTVNPLPVANDHTFQVCEETVGSNNKDNNNFPVLFNDIVTGIVGSTNRTVAWYFDPGGVVNGPADLPIGNLIPGGAADVDAVANGTVFYALVTNDLTSCQNVSAVDFDIQPRPIANPIIGQPNVCASNALVVYQLSTVTPGSTYNWTLPPDNLGFIERVFGGGVNDFFVGYRFPGLTAPPASDLYMLSVVEISPFGCASDPNNFNISVDASPAVNPITGPDPVCKGQTGVAYVVQFPNAANTYSWSITAGDAAIVGPAAGVGRTSIVVDFGTSASSTISVTESSPTGCSLAAAQTLIVNAIDVPVMTSTSTFTMCSGEAPGTAAVPLTFTAAPGGNNFSWRVINVPASVTGAVVGNTGMGDINQVLTNVSGVDGVVTYEVTPTATAPPFCAGPPQTVFVTVQPQPVIVPGQTKLICHNTNTSYSITLAPANLPGTTTFAWAAPTMSAGPAQGSAQAGVAVGPAGTVHISDVLTNTTGAPITATYNVIPSNGTCNYAAVPIIITVEPEPAAAVNNTTMLICNGDNVNLTISTPNTATGAQTFDMAVSSTNAGATAGAAFAALTAQTYPLNITGDLTNSSNAAITVTYTVTPLLAGCPNGPDVVTTVQVEPTPDADISNTTLVVCSSDNVNINITNLATTVGASTFDLAVSSTNAGATGGTAFLGPLANQPYPLPINGTLTNSSTSAITVTYTVTPRLAGCANGTPVITTVQVEPATQAAIANVTPLICNGNVVDIDITTPTTTAGAQTFDLAVSSTNAGATGGTAFTALAAQTYPLNIGGTLTNTSNALITVTFTVTPKLAGCPDGAPVQTTVDVEPTPVADIANGAALICNGGNVNLDITTLSTTSGAQTFDLAVSSTNAGATGGTAFAALAAQTYPLNIGGTLTNSSNSTITVTFTVTPKLALCADGAPVQTTVDVEPTPLADIANTTPLVCTGGNVNINITNLATTASASTYDLTVTSTNAGATGGTAFLAPVVNQPYPLLINGTLTNSSNAVLTVTYTVTPRLTSCANGAPIQTTVQVEPTTQAAIANTTPLVCNGGNVNIDVTTPTTTAGAQTFDLAVSSTNLPATGGTAFAALAGQAYPLNIAGTLTNSSSAVITVTFTATPKLAGCADGAPVMTTVQVEPTPVAAIANGDNLLCNGDNVSLTITSPTTTSGAQTFDLAVSSTNAGATGGAAFAPLVGQAFPLIINSDLTNSSNSVITVTFTVTPKLAGCADGAPVQTTVQVEPSPVAVVNSTIPTVCNGGNVNIQITSPTAPTTPADLRFDLAVTSTNVGATGGSAFVPLGNQAFPILVGGTLTNSSSSFVTVTYTITPKLAGCPNGTPQVVNIVVEPTPAAIVTNNAARLCNGDSPNIDITTVTAPSIPANLTFDVVASLPAGVTGTGTAGTGLTSATAPIAFNTGTLTNTTNLAQTVVYTVIPKLSGCANGTAQVVNVVVEPTPQVSLTNNLAKICNGGTPNITVTSPTSTSVPADLTFDVVVGLPAGVTGTGIAGNGVLGATAPFAINAGTISNANPTSETITYTVTPKLNGCPDGPPQVVNVIVEPTPVAVTNNILPTICNGGTPDIAITSPTIPSVPANLTFDVAVALPAGVTGTGVAGNGTTGASAPFSINTGTITNTNNTFRTVTYTITPRLSGCANGTPQVVNVVVEPSPVAVAVNNAAAICSGGSPSIDVTSPTSPSIPGDLTFDVLATLPVGVTGTGVAGAGLIGATAPFSINTGTLTHDNLSNVPLVVTYTITPKLAGCADGTPQIVNVTVRPLPVGAFDNSRIVCSDEAFTYNIQTANIDALGNGVASNFTFTVSSSDEANVPTPPGLDRTVPSSAAINGNFNNANLAGADVDITYTITPFNIAGNCPGAPFDVVVRIRPEATAPALTTVEHCSDAANPFVFDLQSIIDTGLGGNSVPSNFTYTVSSTNPLSVFPESNRNVASAAPISQIYANFSGVDETITYVVTPFSIAGNCQGTNFELDVVVHPEPVGSNLVDPVCSTTLNHNIQTQITNGLASVFTYTVSSDNGGVPAGPERVVASSALITDVYVNGTGTPANITYTITPFNAANPTCEGSIFTYTVNISPNPTGMNSVEPAVCSDVPFSVDPQVNIVPAVASTFTWTATYDAPMTGPANGTGLIAGSIHNETGGQLFAHYTVIPTAGTCVGAAFTIDLPIDPEPVMLPALSAPAAVCSTNGVSSNPIGVTLDTTPISAAADSYIVSLNSIDPMLTPVIGPTTGTFPANSPSAGLSDAISLDTYRNTTSAQLQVVYTVIPVSVDGCQGDAFDITISVNPEPVLDNPGFPDVCSSNGGINNPVNIVLGTNGTSANAATYQLQNVQYDDGGGFMVALPAGFTANVANTAIGTISNINLVKNDRFRNISPNPVTVRYTVQGFSSQLCASELLDYDVVVNPEPDLLVPAPGLVCSDVITGITLSEIPGTATADRFNINNIIRQAGLVAGGSNASIGLLQMNNAIFNDIFTNTTASPLTVTYKVAPVTALGCVGEERDIVLTITPAPAVNANLNRTVCSDATSNIVFATDPSGVGAGTYRIDNITVAGGLVPNAGVNLTTPRTTANTNEISGDRFVNPTNSPLTVTYRITAIGSVAPFCEGPFRDVVLTVEPTIVAVPNNFNTDICSATPTDIELTSPSMPTAGVITFNYTVTAPLGVTGFVPALSNLPAGHRIQDNLVNNNDNVVTVTYSITPVANGAATSAGCIGMPVDVMVNVEPKPKLSASPLVQTVCESDGVNVSPTNIVLTTTTMPSVGTMEFNVISATPTGGMTLQPATSPLKTTYLNGELIVDQWNNPTLTDQTVTYTLQPVVNGGLGCPGDNVVVTITVKPRPIINAVAPVTVCSGEFRSIPLVTDIPGTFATWTVTPNANITGELNGGGGSLDITLFNTGFNVETVTYTVTPKFNNCDGIPTNIVVTINPTPNIVGLPPTQTVCDGGTLNVPLASDAAGTTFDWVVTDVFNLEAPGFFDGSGTTINQVINNPNGFQAVLIYQITPRTVPAGCVGLPRIMNVNVGSIVATVTPDRTEICSGQRIQMTNSTLGATSHRWFYRVQGTTAEIDVRTTPFVNYQLDNTTSTNPLVYEIVYQAANGLCTVPDVVTPITVYRNVTAGFDEGTVPPIVGGASVVNFTNTSNPVDGAQFRYEWDFGSSSFATPATFVGANPPPVTYSQQGPYQVTMKAINIAAEAATLSCESQFSKTIIVPVLPLVAGFTLDPPAACFPTTIKVIENISTGDVMEWRVVDSNGAVVAVSGQPLPEFFIPVPGIFSVQLTTRDSFTDQVEFANDEFEIYNNPVASFQARPTTVFIPDTEMTTFNFSTGANTYSWDFGDGETSNDREPKHIYKIEGVYDVVLVAGFDHDNGIVCTDTLTQQIVAKQGGQTKVPNAFTPNPAGPSGGVSGSGSFNDVFLPIVKGVEEFNMQIYDRWGNLVFESNSATIGWDGYNESGTLMPAGVYVYKLTLRLSDGQRSTQIGDITMIR
ncbi:MAG: PKD-like domain-containing protein [Cyclobacteriaceae bacterium]